MNRDVNIATNFNYNREITPVVETPAGPVIGTVDSSTGVYCFRGIPYAQPPLGELRWKAPLAVSPWKMPLKAFEFGMPAVQPESILFEVRGPSGELPEDEDCLYLNIYTPNPAQVNTRKLPVMVWIHGGSFYLGSGCQQIYDGNHLAASGRAIIVTLNYRLGVLGFLRLRDVSDIPASGNEGLLDQIAAIEWVRKNISAFGGNPDNITLFGESAGAMCITALLAVPRCRGLFQRAILQSGNPCALHRKERANHLANAFIEQLYKLTRKRSATTATARELLQAQDAILADPNMDRNWGQLPLKPVLDGELLPTTPMDALRNGDCAQVSLLLGNNLDEWNFFSASNPASFTLDDQQIRQHLEWLMPSSALDPLLEHYRQRAESLAQNPWPLWSRTWNLMLTDMIFTLPGLRLLQAHSGDRFHYQFAQPLAAQPMLGACHAVELGYVFGTHGESSLQHLYGGETNAHELSHSVREAWLNFAECGNPGGDWPGFTSGESRRLGQHPEERPFDAAQLSALWQHVSDDILHGYL